MIGNKCSLFAELELIAESKSTTEPELDCESTNEPSIKLESTDELEPTGKLESWVDSCDDLSRT